MLAFILALILFNTLALGQQTGSNYQQCAANLACSINYEKTFQEKINNLGYHTTLQLQTMKKDIDDKIIPLTHDIDILKTNATAIQDDVTRELQHILRTLDHDKAFLHNLSVGVFELAGELHHEQYTRFQDVRKLIEEVNLVKQALGILNNNQSALFNSATCELQLNATTQNATFFENQYRTVLSKYENLQTTLTDIRKQQRVLLGELQEKSREISRLQQTQSTVATARPLPGLHASTGSSTCGDALGMENGQVKDASITSSVSLGSFHAGNARLNDGSGWYTGARTTSSDWVQVDLASDHVLTGIATQGAPCCEVWATNFTIQYTKDGAHWQTYQKDCSNRYFDGNSDQASIKFQSLDPPIVARAVRINVVDFHKKIGSSSNYVGLRMELYGCNTSLPNITQPTTTI